MKILNVLSKFELFRQANLALRKKLFKGTAKYWEERYLNGGNSGRGSYGEFAAYKADFINQLLEKEAISSVIELGCGDGNQLALCNYPAYVGLDISAAAVKRCIATYGSDPTKSFFMIDPAAMQDNLKVMCADLSLSLDVTYHLVEDETYEKYMRALFALAKRFVLIYAWDIERRASAHVYHRKFTKWITENERGWELCEVNGKIDKPLHACDFYLFRKILTQ